MMKGLFFVLFIVSNIYFICEAKDCHGGLKVYYRDHDCVLDSATFQNLSEANHLCKNVAYIGESSKKYFLSINPMKLTEYTHSSNVITNDIDFKHNKDYNFTVIKSLILENYIILLLINDDNRYFYLMINILTPSKSEIYPCGPKTLVFPRIDCDGIYYIKALNNIVYFREWDGSKFNKTVIKKYESNITSLKEIQHHLFGVNTADLKIDQINCSLCYKKIEEKPKEILREESKEILIEKSKETSKQEIDTQISTFNQNTLSFKDLLIILLSLFLFAFGVIIICLRLKIKKLKKRPTQANANLYDESNKNSGKKAAPPGTIGKGTFELDNKPLLGQNNKPEEQTQEKSQENASNEIGTLGQTSQR